MSNESKWARCRRCGHKLYRVLPGGCGQSTIEIKCSSCKTMNLIVRTGESCSTAPALTKQTDSAVDSAERKHK